MTAFIYVFLCSFAVGVIIAPPVIYLIKKLKARQTILTYVSQHKDKEGIPTMGGIIFLVPAVIFYFVFARGQNRLSFVALAVTLAYGLIGGLDDAIKVIFKRNLGLKAYQKIISQLVIAVLATVFAYKNGYVGSQIYIPVIKQYIETGWFYIPFTIIAYIAATNCVNLTDGLDGLAGSTVVLYLSVVFVIIAGIYLESVDAGKTLYAQETYNLLVFVAALAGGIAAFLVFNSHKAKIFMGDTGSLALGGAVASVAVFIKNPLIIATIGIMFVMSGISVIIQVISFKLRKKRVFLMAPLHHHLEMKGLNESKIVSLYSVITVVAGAVTLLII
ncbi:MAG: phospho-N-acetylmuramoyl-pentapeptide-transferase [Clostridiales bacterium]|nr:phospho-N-acetylmuramoyl-pentapeptide-transferase [Clostridiales bacterium]